MSKVSFAPIQPGDAASITSPNNLMSATATATAAINGENVRPEGIDERNLTFPLIATETATSHDRRVNLGSGSLNSWVQIPQGSTWTGTGTSATFSAGAPFTLTLGSTYNYAIIRYSFEVTIEGRVGSTGNFVNEDVGFAIHRDGARLSATQRHVQNSVANSAAAATSEACRSVQSVNIIYYHSLNGTYTFDLRYHINNHGHGTLSPDTANIPWITATEQAVVVKRLSASVIKYK